jgi:hypothetical protein
MAASNTFSGARAVFLINSVPVAFAGGVSGEEMIDYEPVDVIQFLEVREFVPVAYRTSLNAQVFRVVGNSLKKLGILPRQEEIITSGDLEAAIQDTVTRQTLALFQGVRCSGHSFDVTARGIVQENVTFVSIRVLDEFENPA